MVDCILKIKTTLAETAQECLDLFGRGANIEAQKAEDFLAYINTPLLAGFCRVRIDEEFGTALEQIEAAGGSVNADLVRVEWPRPEVWPPFLIEVDDVDIDGNVIGTRMQELGGF